jgi:hypothetical protein
MDKKRIFFFGILAAFLLLWPEASSHAKYPAPEPLPTAELPQPCPSTEVESSDVELIFGSKYTNDFYGFALAFPDGWTTEITLQQTIPYIDPYAIIHRVSFIANNKIQFDLDVWENHEDSFGSWLDWYQKTRFEFPSVVNAVIAGKEAVIYTESDGPSKQLVAFFQHNNLIFRVWTSNLNPQMVEAALMLLDSIEFQDQAASKALISTEAEISVEKAITPSYVSVCCNKSSANNPNYCNCNTDPNKTGNCTWWVFYKYGEVPFRGNASTWWGQVYDYYNWTRKTGTPPLSGRSIAWWNSGTSVGGVWGHVAHISQYSGGTSFTATEMMYCASFNCERTHTYSTSSPGGYIYYVVGWP